MRSDLRATLACGVALTAAAGCLVVSPLPDLPTGRAGSSSGGSSAGGGVIPGGGNAGDAGDAGDGGMTAAGAGGKPVEGRCETNAECMQSSADEPARCRPSDHVCVPLRHEACPIVVGDAANPNAVYFGAFASLDGVAPEDNSILWAHQLALEELSGDDIGGLPDGPNGKRRPLVMIACNNLEGLVEPAMQHLADEVQVPAILATLKPGDLGRAFDTYAKRDIFYLSPVAVTGSLARAPDDGHIWNVLGQPSDFAPAYQALLVRSEAWLRASRALGATPIKVALVATTEAFDTELRNAVTNALTFNDEKTASENGENFLSVTLDAAEPKLADASHAIAQFAPDIVISTASELFLQNNGLQVQLETEWGVTAVGKPRPHYILSPYNAGNLSELRERISGVLDNDPNGQDDNQRYVGVSIAPAPDITLQRAYEVRLRSSFPDAILDTANYYDATYYLAYAMYGAGQEALTGTGIVYGMQRLIAGKQNFDVGPAAITDTFKALAKPESFVHLTSTLGPPDFDAIQGVRPVDAGVFCFSKNGSAARLVPSAARWDRTKMQLVGDLKACNPAF